MECFRRPWDGKDREIFLKFISNLPEGLTGFTIETANARIVSKLQDLSYFVENIN